MKIYVHNIAEPLSIMSDLYEEKHADDIGNAFGLEEHHYLSDVNLDYWLSKHATEDIIGKMQYRKWFVNSNGEKYSRQELEKIFETYNVMCTPVPDFIIDNGITQKKADTVYEQYAYYHAGFDLRLAGEIIAKRDPRAGDLFFKYIYCMKFGMINANMYIMKRKYAIEYYEWMLPILEEFCKISSFKHYPEKYQQRAPGYIAERLLSFFIIFRMPDECKFYTGFNAKEAYDDRDEKKLRFSI